MKLRPFVFIAILGCGVALARAKQEEAPPANAYEAAKAAAQADDGAAAPASSATKTAIAETATNDAADAVRPNPKLKGYDPDGGAGKKLLIIPIDGTIDLGLASFVERVVEGAGPDDIVILEVRTLGGRVDAAIRIRDALLESEVTTVAFIRRAISAGALISLATDTIIMTPGATIGAATPVIQDGGEMKPTSEKVVSYMRAEMASTADSKKRRRDLAEAMVDADIAIKGIIAKGKLLTLTTDRAVELKIAEARADSFRDALTLLNLSGAERAERHTHWAETLARILTDPVVASMLMTFGFLGLIAELFTPGFGIPGAIGVTCLALFFLGQYAANLAGAEEAILFVIGFALLALEIFVIPGFGVTGIAGILCLVIALVMAMVELQLPWDVSFELGYFQEALSSAVIRLAITMVVLLVVSGLLLEYGPKATAGSWLVFKVAPVKKGSSAGLGAEAHGGSLRQNFDHLLHKRGEAKTVLRPAGVAQIDGVRVDVLTDGRFVEPGIPVEVIEVDGHRVVVAPIAQQQDDDDA